MSDIRAILKVEKVLAPYDHDTQKAVLAWMTDKVTRGPIVATKLVTRKVPGPVNGVTVECIQPSGESQPAEPTKPTA